MKVSLLFLLAVLCAIPVAGSCKDIAEVIWPLSRSGDLLILKLPPGYAGRLLYKPDTGKTNIADAPVADELVIMAQWPEFDPASSADSSYLVPHGATMQTLIEPRALSDYYGQPMNKLEYAFDITVETARREACSADVRANSGPVTQFFCQTAHDLDTKPEKFGLKRIGIDFKKYSDYPEKNRGGMSLRDIYYLRDSEDHLQTIILCTAEEAQVPDDGPPFESVAQCEHKFIDTKLNALVSVHYRRAYLPEWREVEAGWRKLLESFVEVSDAKSP